MSLLETREVDKLRALSIYIFWFFRAIERAKILLFKVRFRLEYHPGALLGRIHIGHGP